jgi:type IV pilus assembly protein PilY1
MDFPSGGEQLIFAPIARQNFVAFTSVRPADADDREVTCSTDSRGRFYLFNASTGLTPPGVLGVTGDSDIVGLDSPDINLDVVLSRQKIIVETEGTKVETNKCGPGKMQALIMGPSVDASFCMPSNNLRLQWRELPGVRTY